MTASLFPATTLRTRRSSTTLTAREQLFERFEDRIEVNPSLTRRLVSFQANRNTPFFSWFKYKEGFSSDLVEYFLKTIAPSRGVLLDPFAGAGSALFGARDLGWSSIGIELLPVGWNVVHARLAAESVSPEQFQRALAKLRNIQFADHWDEREVLNHVAITRGAFPVESERDLVGYLAYTRNRVRNPAIQTLLRFAAFSVLEAISFTRKDGQYLRWDYRSRRSRGGRRFDKGEIPSFADVVLNKLDHMLRDIRWWHSMSKVAPRGSIDLRRGSCLNMLPTLDDESVDFVLTSPPYCNRYDYTRTYALELVFLGCGKAEIGALRQQMLSCTVENRHKDQALRRAYEHRGQLKHWANVDHVFRSQTALAEVLAILTRYRDSDKLNNVNVVKMVRNYFYEMAFVIFELARVMRRGARAIIVNDNVRYAGEEVPTDLILGDYAEHFGLIADRIWTLERGKGNSSQQMGHHGRSELRKCVYVWRKP